MSNEEMIKVVAGSAITAGSGWYSFFGSTLVIVQWLAAATAVLVGIATFSTLIHNWKRKR